MYGVGGLTGLAIVGAGLACVVLAPLLIVVLFGIFAQMSLWSWAALLAVVYWLGRSAWRGLNKRDVTPSMDVLAPGLNRGTPPEDVQAVQEGRSTSLSGDEDDDLGWE